MDTSKLINLIKSKAAESYSWEEADEWWSAYGGNFDDAHSLGMDDGEIAFARNLLEVWEEK